MVADRLESVRRYLENKGLSALIVPSNDSHFGEYIQGYYKCREWLSGFTGSAGTLVVTLKAAALWTDSRYFVQAEEQLRGSGIELKKIKIPGTESIEEWISTMLKPGEAAGIDAGLISVGEHKTMAEALGNINLKLIEDPFNQIWESRPPLKNFPIRVLGDNITGESTVSKHSRFLEKLGFKGDFAYIVTSCDESAWLCNVRGNDVEYNPLPLVYSVIEREKITLFCSLESIGTDEWEYLNSRGVDLMDYKIFPEFLKCFGAGCTVIAPESKISASVHSMATSAGAKFIPDTHRGGIIAQLKSIKNEIEEEGFRKAHILDGAAWVRYLKFIDDSQKSGNPMSEVMLAQKLVEFRKYSEFYLDESFEPIVATAANGAMPHYSPDPENPAKIGEGFLLTDMGAHYLFGTTDTTRTLYIGEPSEEERRDYTSVLRGMINLTTAIFPKGTRGSSLDFLARGEVCSREKLYLHGTGHGVGHSLPVHEGPQSIRMEENPVTIEPGMVISNEPAIYCEGRYGIRTENLILCKRKSVNSYGEFFNFETLTLVPIEKKAIETAMLDRRHIEWLNDYHERVLNELSPLLNVEEIAWLSERCSKID